MTSRSLALALLAISLAGCPHAPPPAPAPSPAAQLAIALPGKPNGLFWDASEHRLIIADDEHGKLLAWTDAGGITELADLGADGGLGQPVRRADGSWLVTRFGEGTGGAVIEVPSGGGAPAPVFGPSTERRRIGLAVDDQGHVVDAWFVRGKGVAKQAGVSLVVGDAGSTTEMDLLTGLGKPVGVAFVGDHLYVSDQEAGTIIETTIAPPSPRSVHARVDKPDLLAVGDGGALFTVDGSGTLERIDSDGSVHPVAHDLAGARGVAYDPEGKRVFVAVRGKGGPSQVVIVAVE